LTTRLASIGYIFNAPAQKRLCLNFDALVVTVGALPMAPQKLSCYYSIINNIIINMAFVIVFGV